MLINCLFLVQKHHLPLPSNCIEALHMKFRDEETNGRMSNYEEVTNPDNITVKIKPDARSNMESFKAEHILLLNDSDDGLAGAGELGG